MDSLRLEQFTDRHARYERIVEYIGRGARGVPRSTPQVAAYMWEVSPITVLKDLHALEKESIIHRVPRPRWIQPAPGGRPIYWRLT